VSVGIDSSQLTARGYGESKPIDTTGTKEGKAKNRRVEFTIVSK
jgi:outer membrane protein OmpA-like peptidoglycan-associated protein